jgi:hypothetical protein
MNEGDGKEQKEIDRDASRQNHGVGGFLLYCFCTRKEEAHYHYWLSVAAIGKLELLCIAFSFFKLQL